MTGFVSRRPGMMAMAAAALAMGSQFAPASSTPQGFNAPGVRILGGMTAPQGGIGSMLGAMMNSTGGPGANHGKPRYTNRGGWSCAEAKRRKVRTRNKLRSKGQHRKAVR